MRQGARSSREVAPADDLELLAQEEVVPLLKVPRLPLVECSTDVLPVSHLLSSASWKREEEKGRTRRGAMRFSYCSLRSNS